MYNTVSDGSGGDGVVWGADSHISGMSQSNGNAGDGWHIVSGGNVLDGPTAYLNGCYGMHFDGNQGGDWLASHTYIEPKVILPTSNNPAGYAYYTQPVGTTASTRPSQFCQSIGCITRDGGVTWINIGNANVYLFAIPEFFATFENINSPNISQSNAANHPGDWDDIFVEGTAAHFADENSLLGAKPHQSELSSYPAHGVHFKYARNSSIRDTQWWGGAYTDPYPTRPDLGGLELESSSVIEVDDLSCNQPYNPCLVVTGSSQIIVNKLVSFDGGTPSSPAANIAQIDSASSMVLIDGVEALDLRGTPYQRGIANSGAHVVVKNERYQNVAAGDSGVGSSEVFSNSDSVVYNLPSAAAYQWSIGGTAVGGLNGLGFQWLSPANSSNAVTVSAPGTSFSPYQMTWPTAPGSTGQCLTSSGGGTTPMTWGSCADFAPDSPPPLGNVTPNTMSATALTYQSIPGVSLLVSHFTSIQAAINAAYNNGSVLGTVIDDRSAPYTGPGFTFYDSVILKLAPTTYTINCTVTYNNGNNNVTAGIIMLPGARLLGAGTSTNHGTIVQPANGLNADLIATSTVGSGTATPQWWHWGEIGFLRLVGNGANQTAGDCLKIENMGEVASVHDMEFSACYNNNFENIGYAATQSAITNITSNRAVTRFGRGLHKSLRRRRAQWHQRRLQPDLADRRQFQCRRNAHHSRPQSRSRKLHLQSAGTGSRHPGQHDGPTVLASVKIDGGYAFGTTQQDLIEEHRAGHDSVRAGKFLPQRLREHSERHCSRASSIANTATAPSSRSSISATAWSSATRPSPSCQTPSCRAIPTARRRKCSASASSSATDCWRSATATTRSILRRRHSDRGPQSHPVWPDAGDQSRMGGAGANPGYDSARGPSLPYRAKWRHLVPALRSTFAGPRSTRRI